MDEWADDNYDHSGLGFIGGTSLHVHTELHAIDAAAMTTFGRAPGWGSEWKGFVRQNAARFTSAYLQTSTFPYEATFLDLDTVVRDPLGDPVCRVTTSAKENEMRSVQYAQKKMEEWYRAAGAIEVFIPPPLVPGLSTHAFGGTRMGDNADTNVVDRWGFARGAKFWRSLARRSWWDERCPQPDIDNPGTGVAHSRAFGQELEIDIRLVGPVASFRPAAELPARRAFSNPEMSLKTRVTGGVEFSFRF